MVTLGNIALDVKASNEGIWADYVPGFGLRIARWNNPAHVVRLNEVVRPFRGRKMTDEEGERLSAEAMCGSVLLDWRGLEESTGGPAIPFSVEKAVEILTDPRYRALADFVSNVARNEANYREESLASIVGN